MTGVGSRVRTLTDLLADDATVIPANSLGTVVGYEGERLVVQVSDLETDTTRTATANVWEIRSTAERKVPA